MDATKKHGIGRRVKIIPQHWLRGGEIGQIVGFEQRGQNNWLIKFERRFSGGGIDGDKLWLSQRDFVDATEEDESGTADTSGDFVLMDLNGSSAHQFEADRQSNLR